jgi:protein tyrosine phosphatase
MLSQTFNYIFVSYPDDYNRVVLEPLDDTPDSDYVNASYVDVSNLCNISVNPNSVNVSCMLPA